MSRSAFRTGRLAGGIGLSCLAATVYACGDGSGPTPPGFQLPTSEQVTVQYEADDQLIFLEPLAEGSPTAPLATGLSMEVEVCDVTDTQPVCLPVEPAMEQDSFYGARWDSEKQAVGNEYSIVVRLNDIRIGELRVVLEQGGGENAGRTFPIKFWVGEGLGGVSAPAVVGCITDDRCNAGLAPPDETTEIVTVDEGGNTMAVLTFPPGAAPQDLVVTLDCRIGGYAPGDGPLPTVLDQWPLFCHVNATELDGTAFTGSLNSDAAIEICVVDNDIKPQEVYHAFNHADLRLAKSNGPGDLTLLAPAPLTNLTDCAGLTAVAQGPAGQLFDALGSRFASLLGPFLPGTLHATVFRDGGVSALLTSFSDINPVEMAYVEGSIVGVGADLSGVLVTLSGGFLPGPVSVDATDDGAFDFETQLLAANTPGTTYTVTLDEGSLPDGVSVVENVVQVLVDGTGTFNAEFTALPDAIIECIGSDRCDATVIPQGGGSEDEVVIQAKQGDGGPVIAELTIDPDDLPEPLIIALDCRSGLGEFGPGEGPLPTDLDQYPVFCTIDASSLDGLPFTGSLVGGATAQIDVCEIDDEDFPDLGSFHPPSTLFPEGLRIGKYNATEGFVILPPNPAGSSLSCDGVTIMAANDGLDFLDALGSRVASLLGHFTPEPLHASVFRDGGVSALLSSFSDINMVAPAFISGTVTGSGIGLSGVTLEITGGGLVAPLTATTDGAGAYAFEEALDAAEGGGSTYTVTVTGGLPTGLVLDSDQDVLVTGTGEVVVDFEAAGVLFDGGTLAGGSGTVFDWTVGTTSGTSSAPFATNQYPSCGVLDPIITSPVGTDGVWPQNSIITLTKSFFVPAGTTSLTLTGWVDNDARVTILDASQNSTNITGTPVDVDGWMTHEGCANVNPLVFTAPQGSFTPGGVNTLVIEVRDRGAVGYADFELAANN